MGVGQGANLLLGSDIIINEWSAFQIPPSDVGQRDLQPSCLDKSHTRTPTHPLNSLVTLAMLTHSFYNYSPLVITALTDTHSIHCHTHTPSSSLSHSHPHLHSHPHTSTCTHPLTQLILATLSWLGFIVVCVPSVLTSASSWFSVTNSASMAARSPALGRSWKCRGVKWSGDRGITVGRVVRTNNTEGSNCS